MSAPTPGSAEWLRFMTASKISAVVGTSAYESRFSLWHRMAGLIGPQEQSEEMTYGHYLEPVLLKWFADQHPELTVTPGHWVQPTGTLWGATPDGIFHGAHEGLVQCKTGRQSWEWADGVPPGYYDQVQWEMFVTGEHLCYIVADIAMEFREYPIERDQDRIDYLVTEAETFMASLEARDAPPIDGSTFTYIAIREMHPDIDDVTVEIDGSLAAQWLGAKTGLELATETEQQYRSQIVNAMGSARRAAWDGRPLITRQARNGGTPYAVAARQLPTIGASA